MSTDEIRTEAAQPAAEPQNETNMPPQGDSGAAKSADPNLADELREFGKQIEGLFNTARTSPRGQEIEKQLTAAWRDVETGVNAAINKAQNSDVKATVQGTAQYATDEMQGGLARGLRSLNQWMSGKITQADENRKKREAEASDAATHGTADNGVADRFDNGPVFGKDLHVPEAPVHVTPDSNATNADNPVSDRFSNPISFGDSGEVK